MDKEAYIVYLTCNPESEYETLRTTRVDDWTDFISFTSSEYRFLIRNHWYTKDDLIQTRPIDTHAISFEIGPEDAPELLYRMCDELKSR